MNYYDSLYETVSCLFREAVQMGDYTEDEVEELLEGIDFHSLLQAVRHKAMTVYSYITQGSMERSFNYRSRELFDQKATLLYVEPDQSTAEIVLTTRNLELWILEDMTLAVVSCITVDYGDGGYMTQYRTLLDEPVWDSELCLELEELTTELQRMCGPVFECLQPVYEP